MKYMLLQPLIIKNIQTLDLYMKYICKASKKNKRIFAENHEKVVFKIFFFIIIISHWRIYNYKVSKRHTE